MEECYNNYDKVFKIILLGNSSVGKSNIMNRYVSNNFNNELNSTIGVDFKNVKIQIKNEEYEIQIWDTAGQERFKSFLSTYFKGTHGIIICYDITNEDSFNSINSWIDEIKKALNLDDIIILLVGNKIDLEDDRQISQEKGKKYSEENNFLFIETSAKTNENNNINKLFENITTKIIEKYISIQNKLLKEDEIVKNSKKKINLNKKNKRGCC